MLRRVRINPAKGYYIMYHDAEIKIVKAPAMQSANVVVVNHTNVGGYYHPENSFVTFHGSRRMQDNNTTQMAIVLEHRSLFERLLKERDIPHIRLFSYEEWLTYKAGGLKAVTAQRMLR